MRSREQLCINQTSQCKWWPFSRTPENWQFNIYFDLLTPWNSKACSLAELTSSDIIRPWISAWGSRSASGSLQSSPSGLCIDVANKIESDGSKPKNVISSNVLQYPDFYTKSWFRVATPSNASATASAALLLQLHEPGVQTCRQFKQNSGHWPGSCVNLFWNRVTDSDNQW